MSFRKFNFKVIHDLQPQSTNYDLWYIFISRAWAVTLLSIFNLFQTISFKTHLYTQNNFYLVVTVWVVWGCRWGGCSHISNALKQNPCYVIWTYLNWYLSVCALNTLKVSACLAGIFWESAVQSIADFDSLLAAILPKGHSNNGCFD